MDDPQLHVLLSPSHQVERHGGLVQPTETWVLDQQVAKMMVKVAELVEGYEGQQMARMMVKHEEMIDWGKMIAIGTKTALSLWSL